LLLKTGSSKKTNIAVAWIYRFYNIKPVLLVLLAVEKGEKEGKTDMSKTDVDIPVMGI
jgi:hypothetical protein